MAKTPEEKRREYMRRYYVSHNRHRVGTKPGPKKGTVYYGPTSEAADRARVEAFRKGQTVGSLGSDQLRRTCEFCLHHAYRYDQAMQFCERDCTPPTEGVCPEWQPRYRTDDDGESVASGRSANG